MQKGKNVESMKISARRTALGMEFNQIDGESITAFAAILEPEQNRQKIPTKKNKNPSFFPLQCLLLFEHQNINFLCRSLMQKPEIQNR